MTCGSLQQRSEERLRARPGGFVRLDESQAPNSRRTLQVAVW